jgi:hypothetical protein
VANPRGASIRVEGLREVNRAFSRISDQVGDGIKRELLKLAEPVAAEGRSRIGHYAGASTSTITPIATLKGAIVRQRARSKHVRGDFGALQMTHLLGAVEDQRAEIENGVEDFIDFLGRKEGF